MPLINYKLYFQRGNNKRVKLSDFPTIPKSGWFKSANYSYPHPGIKDNHLYNHLMLRTVYTNARTEMAIVKDRNWSNDTTIYEMYQVIP
jgi:hypothetical protein